MNNKNKALTAKLLIESAKQLIDEIEVSAIKNNQNGVTVMTRITTIQLDDSMKSIQQLIDNL